MTTFIAGGYGCGNIGDDAMLQGLKNRYDSNAREIYVFHRTSPQAVSVKDVVDDIDGFKKIAEVGDVLIIGGGSIFFPSESLETTWKMVQNAERSGLSTEIRGIGIDEIESETDEAYIRQLCEIAAVIQVRTEESARLLKNMGVSKQVSVTPDYANYVEPDNAAAVALKNQLKFDNDYPLVGLSISLNTAEHTKIGLLIETLQYILDFYKVNIVAIPHTRHFDSDSENDYIPAEIIFSQLKRTGRYDILPWGFTIEGLLGLYGKLEASIGMRYHSFVFANKMNVPLLGISRENKHKIYLQENGLPWVNWNELSNAQPLMKAANRLINPISKSFGGNDMTITEPIVPKVSVILPTYGHADSIEKALHGLYSQTFKEWELVIVNDCSPDDTEKHLYPYLGDARVKYIKNEKNVGEWAAVLTALEQCEGKYIAYLHSDDLWYPNHLQVLYDYLEANPDKQIAYTAMHAWGKYVKHLEIMDIPMDADISGKEKHLIARGNFMVPVQVMHLKSCYERHKPTTREESEAQGDYYTRGDRKVWSKFLQDYNLGFIDMATLKWTTNGKDYRMPSVSSEKSKEYYQYPGVKEKKERLLKEIAAYLNWTSDKVEERLTQGSSRLAEEWRQQNPENPDQVMQFYTGTENYIFDLALWHQEPHVMRWTHSVVDFCCQKGLKTVLDYGCGIGEDGLALAALGFDVTFADVPSKGLDFTKWRADTKGVPAAFIEIRDDFPLKEAYDVVICFEVLEHLWDPEAIVKHIYQHTAKGGYFFATVSFDDEGNHPMHLQHNFYLRGDKFVEMMKTIGFQPVRTTAEPLIFQKTG